MRAQRAGKTEVTQQLANIMGVELVRFDMLNIWNAAVSRLIGAPPGCRFRQGGLVTNAVIKNPYSVVLLDEIEKAHIDIITSCYR